MVCRICHTKFPCSRTALSVFVAVQVFAGIFLIQWGKGYQVQYCPDETVQDILSEADRSVFKNFTNNDTITLLNDTNTYFHKLSEHLTCYAEGTDLNKTKSILNSDKHFDSRFHKCLCLFGYHGDDCGIPDVIWHSRYRSRNYNQKLKRRTIPRRVINGIPVLNETDMLEARLHELSDVVDIFLLGESSYSSHGDVKDLFIRTALNEGFLEEYRHKILHVFVDFFPELGRTNNDVADEYLRVYMGKMGIPRINGILEDDLFIINDADEIPSRPLIKFLKLYDGFTEPIQLIFRWSIFGFFWKNKDTSSLLVNIIPNWNAEKTVNLYSIATMGLVTEVMENDPFIIRKQTQLTKSEFSAKFNKYLQNHPGLYDPWSAGAIGHYAGWHCSWCFGWFDGSSNLFLADSSEPQYAPPYVLANEAKFATILYHPKQYKPKKITKGG